MLISNFGIIANSGGAVLTAVEYANLLAAGDSTYVNDSTAIELIANDADACTIIRGSATAISVLDSSTIVTIPTMTSASAPSGVASASTELDPTDYPAWKAMDKLTTTDWSSAANAITNQWVEYTFSQSVWIYKISLVASYTTLNRTPKNFKLQYSTDNTNWVDAYTGIATYANQTPQYFKTAYPSGKTTYWRFFAINNNGNTLITCIGELDFYGKTY